MELPTMCRICLVEDVRMQVVVNSNLLEMYESLTSVPLEVKDNRPTKLCYICYARLRNCYQLKQDSLQSEELLTRMLSSHMVIPEKLEGTQKNRLTTTAVTLWTAGQGVTPLMCEIKKEPPECDVEVDPPAGGVNKEYSTNEIKIEQPDVYEDVPVKMKDLEVSDHGIGTPPALSSNRGMEDISEVVVKREYLEDEAVTERRKEQLLDLHSEYDIPADIVKQESDDDDSAPETEPVVEDAGASREHIRSTGGVCLTIGKEAPADITSGGYTPKIYRPAVQGPAVQRIAMQIPPIPFKPRRKIVKTPKTNAEMCRDYYYRKKAEKEAERIRQGLPVQKPKKTKKIKNIKTVAERARAYRLRKKMRSQVNESSVTEISSNPSTSNSRISISEPSNHPLATTSASVNRPDVSAIPTTDRTNIWSDPGIEHETLLVTSEWKKVRAYKVHMSEVKLH